MRLLILLLAIVIGNARARECKWNTQADYDINDVVLTFKNNCTSIGFVNYNCYGFPSEVTSVVLQQGLQQVGDNAFDGCSSLTSVTFPEGLQQVGEHAFYGCSSLTSVTFPEGLQLVGESAFEECSSLTSVSFSTVQQMLQIQQHGINIIIGQVGPDDWNFDIALTIRGSNPCYEGNYHSDACKNKIAEAYDRTAFIDLYNRNYTSTCS